MAQLRICELNTENLFISLDHYQGGGIEHLSEKEWRHLALPQLRRKQKSLKKLWSLSSAILDINADVLMLIEVGGKESLHHFNDLFLEKKYVAHFVESNSARTIDLAFLVKKNLPFEVEAISNRDMPIEVQAYQGAFAAKFSRDVAQLNLSKNHKLEMILLLTHLKSKISSDRDFQGKDMRTAEAVALAALYEKARAQYPDVPIVVGGDFNASLESPELAPLTRTDLTDLHDILQTPPDQRVSFVHFDYKKVAHPQVLDYLLLSPQLKTHIVPEKSGVYHYKSFYDIPYPQPKTPGERYMMPSDHYPVVLTLNLA